MLMHASLPIKLVAASTKAFGLHDHPLASKKSVMTRPTKIRPEDVLAISDRLRALRISTGLTQSEFAERYGFTQTQWGNFEAAHSRIGIDAALVLLRELRTPLDWIYTGETAWLPSGLKEKIAAVEPRPIKRAAASGQG